MPKAPAKTIINTNMDQALAKMDRDKVNKLVISETVAGKSFTILEIERKMGALAKDNQNNVLC